MEERLFKWSIIGMFVAQHFGLRKKIASRFRKPMIKLVEGPRAVLVD